jgi:hypothetical protein
MIPVKEFLDQNTDTPGVNKERFDTGMDYDAPPLQMRDAYLERWPLLDLKDLVIHLVADVLQLFSHFLLSESL